MDWALTNINIANFKEKERPNGLGSHQYQYSYLKENYPEMKLT
jgi:hypothetical protein